MQPKSKTKGILLDALKGGISELRTVYGGGEQGIANKLKRSIQEGAGQYQQGVSQMNSSNKLSKQLGGLANASGGLLKTGFRTAGDVAGTIYAPIGAAVGATGIGKAFDAVGKASQHRGGIMDRITSKPSVQKFAMNNPNAEEDFGRAMSLGFATMNKGRIEPRTVTSRTLRQFGAIPKPNANVTSAKFQSIKKDLSSSGHNFDKIIAKGEITPEQLNKIYIGSVGGFKLPGSFTPEYAKTVISDLSGKLNGYQPGLGAKFVKSVSSVKYPTANTLIDEATKILEKFGK